MSARKDQLTRIFNSVTGTTIAVQLKHRDSAATEWKDADVIQEATFDCSKVPELLANGDEQISPATYGIWKALSERISDYSVDEKIAGMQGVFDMFVTGQWKAPSARRSTQVDAFLVQAVVNIKTDDHGQPMYSITQVQAMLNALEGDQLKALRTNATIVAEVARLKAEAAEVDTDALAGLL